MSLKQNRAQNAVVPQGGACSVLQPHDCLDNSCDQFSHTSSLFPPKSPVNQIVVAIIVISSNMDHV